MNKINYQLQCEKVLAEVADSGQKPKLLLHVCCAPCASYVIEYLEKYFELTLFFYNPNITDYEEYLYRYSELQRFVEERGGTQHKIVTAGYEKSEFFAVAKGYESEPEGGKRCLNCYRLRLERSARYASETGHDYFATTLSISPYKRTDWLNSIGEELSREYNVKHLPSDFKKRGGYLRSIELSSIYDLYRQDFCGCAYSKAESELRRRGTSQSNNVGK